MAAKKDTAATDTAAAATTTETKTKTTRATTAKKVDVFNDVATSVEGMTKAKALSEAVKCAKESDDSLFKLGGILAKILENKWYEDYETFGEYVEETFGFKERKARYLIEIYVELINQRIPYEKVAILGWTKIKMLAKLLDVNNVDEWVERAGQLSVRELQAVIDAQNGKGGEGDEDKNTETKNSVKSMSFKLHPDQVDAVNSALAKAKADVNTEFDNVAIEHICNTFLGDNNALDMVALMQRMGVDAVIDFVDQAFPDVNFSLEEAEPAEDTPL